MVGVAGKFKGCNTCRSRRVKCDNLRPHCKKCLDSGRECAGYDRERVFIVGTAMDRGRCSSHPHRSLMGHRNVRRKPAEARKRKLANKSNDDSRGVECLAIQTGLPTLEQVFRADGTTFTLRTTPLDHTTSLSQLMQYRDFSLRAACLLNVDTNETEDKKTLSHRISTFVFLYDLGTPPQRSSIPLKAEPGVEYREGSGPFQHTIGGTSEEVRLHGPGRYTSLPSHQFFARIFRPHLCFHALTHRYPTFLADSDWCTIPWQAKTKTRLDTLFDIFVLLPEIFTRGEELEAHPPSISRRLHAKDLLEQCAGLDQKLETWLNNLNTQDEKPSWWEGSTTQNAAQETSYPTSTNFFDTKFEFRDVVTAESMLYYWAGQCSFYRAVQHIHAICIADIAALTSPEIERQSYTDVPSSSPTLEFTPPQQRQEQDLLFGADWNQSDFMPVSTAEQISPIYDPDLTFSQYLPDPFASQPIFSPDLPVEFGYETSAQSFLPSGVEFEAFLPQTQDFSQAYSPSPSQFYSYDPTTFLIPATPTINTNIPTSFPPITRAASLSYPSLSPTYLLSASTPSSRHNSTSRAHSFSLSHPHPAAPPSYIHSRSPTPTHTALSSAPSSNPSLRNSISNPVSNPNSVGNGYATTPPPSSTSHPNLVDLGLGTHSLAMLQSLPVVPDLDPKFMEPSVATIAGKIARAAPFLLSTSLNPRLGYGAENRGNNGWEGGGAVSIAIREATKVFRRQSRTVEVEWCKRLVEQGTGGRVAEEVRGGVWMEWSGI